MELINIVDIVSGEYNASFLPNKYRESIFNMYMNFYLKHMSIINRMLYLNQIVIPNLHYSWQENLSEVHIDNSTYEKLLESNLAHKNWQRKFIYSLLQQEEFVMHLRKLIDDCISLFCVAKQRFNENGKPLESIGELAMNIEKFPEFEKHLLYLRKVNQLSNSLKHSVVHPMFRIGRDEPSIYSMHLKKNGSLNDLGESIDILIKDFNDFYCTFDKYLKE